MGLAPTLVESQVRSPDDKHRLAQPAKKRPPAITTRLRGPSLFQRQKKKKPRITVGFHPALLGAFLLTADRFQPAGFSPYQRGVYTHSPPPARANAQVVDEPISTMVRMSTCSGVSCPRVVTRRV